MAGELTTIIPPREAGRVDAEGGRVGPCHAERPHPALRATLPALTSEEGEASERPLPCS